MSLYQQILAALSGMPTQHERLLRLHTPLGPDVLLAERLNLREDIGPAPGGTITGLHAQLHVLAADTHIELKALLGQPLLLQLELADGTLRPWHGHVTAAELQGSDGGLARYALTIEPWLSFLAQRQDSWVFQDQTVVQIVEEVFADHSGAGPLAPAWRWELADPAAYPSRSLCIQYHETDLAFVQRLLREEGLFCWWEHGAAVDDPSLGRHTLVIADHPGAFATNPHHGTGRVRYTQAGLALKEDSLTRWGSVRKVRTAAVQLASQDYRSNGAAVALRPQQQSGQGVPEGTGALALTDVPGLYAYEDDAQGERLALRQMQALDALRHQVRASGTLRLAAPGSTVTLCDHPLHDGSVAARDEHVILAVQHTARNNLRADHRAQVLSLLGAIVAEQALGDVAAWFRSASPNDTEEPVYASALLLQPAAVPVRMAGGSAGRPDVRLHPRPTIQGMQTALVVGTGEPVHTDRDHRVKVQFHWQRGSRASHRLPHPAGCNAPASDASGTWVRVSQASAGANWGVNFIPRVGQEVMVGFVGGDIDRPVVTGAVYNGQGQPDAQSNQVSAGAAGAVGDAPAWFPGGQARGSFQGHQHPAVMAGHKSQELASSASGTGGYNQLVFDDTPGQGRIELSSTMAQSRLQLGHLLLQTDNQRLQPRGHGADLGTAAWGALRAGSGLLISAHGRPGGSLSGGRHIDPREPRQQLDQGRELAHVLAQSAQAHGAKLTGEPAVAGTTQQQSGQQLPVERAAWGLLRSLDGSQQRQAAGGGGGGGSGGASGGGNNTSTDIGGGAGSVSAWARPDLLLAAPAGIALQTPAHAVYSAGSTVSLSAGQDIQHLAQGQHAMVAKDGLVLFTYGKAQAPDKPNKETGLQMHAASGNVNTQSQTGATKLTADKAVTVSSTQGMVRVTAPSHVLLAAAGAAIEIKGGNITLKGPGKVEFRASMKELAGAGAASASLQLKRPGPLKGCAKRMQEAAVSGSAV